MTETTRFYLTENTTFMRTLIWMNEGIFQKFKRILYTLHSDFRAWAIWEICEVISKAFERELELEWVIKNSLSVVLSCSKRKFQNLDTKMKSSSSSVAKNQGEEVSNVQLVKSDTCPPPKYHVIPGFSMKGASMGMLSSIPPKVIMIHNVLRYYMCKISEVGDYEIRLVYQKLCDGVLKDELKIFVRKGLTHALDLLINFKI